jgi:hypothetical protein
MSIRLPAVLGMVAILMLSPGASIFSSSVETVSEDIALKTDSGGFRFRDNVDAPDFVRYGDHAALADL